MHTWLQPRARCIPRQLLPRPPARPSLSLSVLHQVRAAHAIHPIACVELEWSLFTRDAEARGTGGAVVQDACCQRL